MRSLRSLLVLLAVAALNLLAACTPEDDNDQLPPESPTPTPEPTPVFNCQVVWTSLNDEEPELLDVFVVDAPEETWRAAAGLTTFQEFTAFYQPAVDVPGNTVAMTLDTRGAVVSSSDTFTVTLLFNETDEGADVELSDATTNLLLGVGTDGEPTTAVVGSNTALAFDGVWSSRDPEESVDLGQGQVTLVLGTAATTVMLGDYGAFAICYDRLESASAAGSPVLVNGLSRLP